VQTQASGRLSPLGFQMRRWRHDNHCCRPFGQGHPRGHERECRLDSARRCDRQKVRLPMAGKTLQGRVLPRAKPNSIRHTRAIDLDAADYGPIHPSPHTRAGH